MHPNTVEHPHIHINGNSGYSRHGDTVSLFADGIDNANNVDVSSDNLALQLWACQSPYYGGDLAGWKLAELQLGPLQANHQLAPVKSDVLASFPESGDYAIALVIAEWDGEGFNRVHDFHNYPNRDVFLHPRMEGLVGYQCVDERRVVVDFGRIYNPRDPDNLSGTLSLELWALPEPYKGGAFEGHALASITLGSLAGGESWQDCAYELEMTPPTAGSYTLALMLREWVGNGYVTRDHTNFDHPLTFPIDIAELETIEVNTALAQVANAGQSTSQQSKTTVAKDVAETDNQAESLQLSGTHQESEMTEADTAEAQVASSGRSTGQKSETTLVEDVADTDNQAESSQPKDTQRASEVTEVDGAEAQVERPGKSTGQASLSSLVEDEVDAEPQAARSQPADMKQTSAARGSKKILTGGESDATKSFGQRLLELFQTLKQWLRL
jgi:hypothetical protein